MPDTGSNHGCRKLNRLTEVLGVFLSINLCHMGGEEGRMGTVVLRLLYIMYRVPLSQPRRLIRKLVKIIEGGEMWSACLRKIYKDYHAIEVGYGTYGGAFDLNNIQAGVCFGNYCSINGDVHIYTVNHPTQFVTTHPILYAPALGNATSDERVRNRLIIGHDVWIGRGVSILPTVHFIGDGAIIGAGTILTKDVPPYAIVVGNPGRVIKFRFSTNQISRLQDTKWWNWDRHQLAKYANGMRAPDVFLKCVESHEQPDWH